MKFSTKKKAKMRKIRLERNKRIYHGTGFCVEGDNRVIDRLPAQNNLYLLTISGNNQCKIFKVISCHEVVEMSPKRILNKRRFFQNTNNWKEHTKIELDDSGEIKAYTPAPNPWEKFSGRIVIFVEV